MNYNLIIAIIIAAIPFILVCFMIGTYNKIKLYYDRVLTKWNHLEELLLSKLDTITMYLETTGNSNNNQQLNTTINSLKQEILKTNNINKKLTLNDSINLILDPLISNSNLASNPNTKEYFEKIESIENQIDYTNKFYNDYAEEYNQSLMIFPNKLICKLLSIKPLKTY